MILGLDLGVNVGWVLGAAVGPLRHGTFQCDDTTDLGRFLKSMDPFLQAILPLAKGIAVEQPFLGDSYYPARKLLGQLGMVYYWAGFYGIGGKQIVEVPVATGKLTLAGYGMATKERMIQAAAERGYPDIRSEHEADALGLWWVYVFGRQEAIRKPRSRSSKGVSVGPSSEPVRGSWLTDGKMEPSS